MGMLCIFEFFTIISLNLKLAAQFQCFYMLLWFIELLFVPGLKRSLITVYAKNAQTLMTSTGTEPAQQMQTSLYLMIALVAEVVMLVVVSVSLQLALLLSPPPFFALFNILSSTYSYIFLCIYGLLLVFKDCLQLPFCPFLFKV